MIGRSFPGRIALKLASVLVLSLLPATLSLEMVGSTAAAARALGLFVETPLIRSIPLSRFCERDVYLKLDLLQASGSFKDRGMAFLCHTLKEKEGISEVVSSSGGNAGLAVATVGQQLGLNVHVIVPKTTKALVIAKLESLGAKVTVHGENWNQADEYTRGLVGEHAAYVSPYDNPLLWTGHSTLVEELKEQLPGQSPSAILVSVGGGGLICGVLEGMQNVGWKDCRVVAAETTGASSFGQAWKAQKLVRLNAIDSIATSLGALEVTPVALERAQQHGDVEASICTDAEAVDACLAIARDHRVLVEPACGAALATLYSERLRVPFLQGLKSEGPIVVEVCGGSGVTADLLMQWRKDLLDDK